MREIVAREKPVEFAGEQYQMPLAGGTGLGKPLKSTIHPFRTDLPIYLGAEGPKNVALAAEIADGWLPLFFSPKDDAHYRGLPGRGVRGQRRGRQGRPLRGGVDDVHRARRRRRALRRLVRPFLALYVGGMGARGANFHFEVFARMGYEAEALHIQDLYLDGQEGRSRGLRAAADGGGRRPRRPVDKIRDELARWKETCLTTMLVSGPAEVLPLYADLVLT